jgi:DNA processing protein
MPSQTDPLLALIHAPHLGVRARHLLLDYCGSAAAIAQMSDAGAKEIGLRPQTLAAIRRPRAQDLAPDQRWLHAAPNRHLIGIDHAAYPTLLRELDDAPIALFVEGNPAVLRLPQVAIVGSRNASAGGRQHARTFVRALATAGLAITSGLALGIDGEAHASAIDFQTPTIAVLASGLQSIYPKRHAELAKRIVASGGAIISEMPAATPPRPEYFPQRNRIISGLSLAVVVVEASLQSGSLITARMAAEQGREVFAIPGSIDNPAAKGCHKLLREGATLAECGEDVLAQLPAYLRIAQTHSNSLEQLGSTLHVSTKTPLNTADPLRHVLGFDPVAYDDLLARSKLPATELAAQLLELELHGQAERLAGGFYRRCAPT